MDKFSKNALFQTGCILHHIVLKRQEIEVPHQKSNRNFDFFNLWVLLFIYSDPNLKGG